MKCELQTIDELNAKINITIEQADYEEKFLTKLKEYKGKAQMKGFRKGKTSMNTIMKFYGTSTLVEIVNVELQNRLMNYVQDQKLNLFGSPIQSVDSEVYDFKPKDRGDYVFSFDVGLLPEFEPKGVSSSDQYDDYELKITDDLIEKDLAERQKRLGERTDVEKDINENDIITVSAKEKDGDKIKADGWKTEFGVLMEQMGNEDLKNSILGKGVGHVFEFDVNHVEKNANEDFINKYILKLPDDETDQDIGQIFEGTITKITRLNTAELDKDFFEKAFPGKGIENVEDAKAEIKEIFQGYFKQQQEAFTNRMMLKKLVDHNDFALPDAFVKRWLKLNDEKLTDEYIETNFGQFQNEIRWSILKGKLIDQFEIKIEQEELLNRLKDKFRGYFANNGMALPDGIDLDSIALKSLEDRESTERESLEMLSEKLFVKLQEEVKMKTKKVTSEEFSELVKKDKEESNF